MSESLNSLLGTLIERAEAILANPVVTPNTRVTLDDRVEIHAVIRGLLAALPPAPPQEQEPHDAFERWMLVNNPDMKLARWNADDNQPYDYVNAFTEAMWQGWRAAMEAINGSR